MNGSKITKYIDWIIEALAIMGYAAIIIMMIIGVIGVAGNWVKFPVTGVVEWTEILNVVAITLPVIYVTRWKKHIEIDLVTTFLPPRPKRILYFITLFPILFFSVLIAWQSIPQAVMAIRTGEYQATGPATVYYWPGKLSVAIGFTGMALVTFSQIINQILKRKQAGLGAA